MSFPCSGCGCCCKRVDQAVRNTINFPELAFPFKWDKTGRCEMLVDNKCSVYENRPLLCNIDKVIELFRLNKESFYKDNKKACNSFMDEDNIPVEYRL